MPSFIKEKKGDEPVLVHQTKRRGDAVKKKSSKKVDKSTKGDK